MSDMYEQLGNIIVRSRPPLSQNDASRALRLLRKIKKMESVDEIKSIPPSGGKEVTNLYIEMVDGNPKLRVEYED